MMNTEHQNEGFLRCFWDRANDPATTDPCPNPAQREIYWDGTYKLICDDCFPEAEAARQEILSYIDDHYWS